MFCYFNVITHIKSLITTELNSIFISPPSVLFYSMQIEGLSELEKGSKLQESLRGPLCSIILVAYHTVVSFVLGKYCFMISIPEIVLYMILIFSCHVSLNSLHVKYFIAL